MITSNAHTHTRRCKHASGEVRDYCSEALRQGLQVLGISDHTPLPDGRWDTVRMDIEELGDYCADIAVARNQFPDLHVLAGMECEYDKDYVSFYEDDLLEQCGLDYLIGAAHWYPHQGEWLSLYGARMGVAELKSYTDYLIATMNSGLFAFLAHPDLFANVYLEWDREAEACVRAILGAAESYCVPLEINGYGFRKPQIETPSGTRLKYPWLPFWELAREFNVDVIINSDAHQPRDVTASMGEAASIAESLGLSMVYMDENAELQPVIQNEGQ